MSVAQDWHLARALLEWQMELGVSEAIGSEPIDRFDSYAQALAQREEMRASALADHQKSQGKAKPKLAPQPPPPDVSTKEHAEHAAKLAAGAADLPALAEALAGFSHCELRKGARSCVFADGVPKARVMIIGEGPGADEDRRGLPFVGRAGQLLDQMFGAIGLSRQSPDTEQGIYITNTVPWRPPGNREPTADELTMLRPFLLRHIELAEPEFLVLMGNVACDALLGRRGIMRMRGNWTEAAGLPALPMMHPAFLLRTPIAKREAWADLLSLNARLKGAS